MSLLIDEEVTRCEKWLAANAAIKTPPRLPLKKFVERCAALHERLVERWEGWSFQGPVTLADDTTLQLEAVRTEVTRWGMNVHALPRERKPEVFQTQLALVNSKRANTQICDYRICAYRTIPETLSEIGTLYDLRVEEGNLTLCIGTWQKVSRTGNIKTMRIEAPVRVGQRFAAIFSKAMEDLPDKYPELRKEYEKLLVRLGEAVWAGKQKPTAVTLTCAPLAFLRLGHYDGVDPGSCYRNSAQHDSSKLFLASDIPDTFVLHTYRGAPGEDAAMRARQVEGSKPNGRGWGIAVPQRGAVVSNFYGLTKEIVYAAVLAAVEQGLDVPKPAAFGAKSIKVRDGQNQAFYTNQDCTYLAGETAFRQKFVEHYLDEILNYSDKLGLYTRTGQGPVRPLPKLKQPSVWPYPEIDFSVIPEGSLFV